MLLTPHTLPPRLPFRRLLHLHCNLLLLHLLPLPNADTPRLPRVLPPTLPDPPRPLQVLPFALQGVRPFLGPLCPGWLSLIKRHGRHLARGAPHRMSHACGAGSRRLFVRLFYHWYRATLGCVDCRPLTAVNHLYNLAVGEHFLWGHPTHCAHALLVEHLQQRALAHGIEPLGFFQPKRPRVCLVLHLVEHLDVHVRVLRR